MCTVSMILDRHRKHNDTDQYSLKALGEKNKNRPKTHEPKMIEHWTLIIRGFRNTGNKIF